MKKRILSALMAAVVTLTSVGTISVTAETDPLTGSAVIYSEDFEGSESLESRVDTNNGSAIENGVVKSPNGCGFVINSATGVVEDAPLGAIRVNFDMKAPNNGAAATKAELVTDSGNFVLISYGVWGGLRPNPTEGDYNAAGFEGDVWYNNDFILDFNNNKMYITVTKKDTGEKLLDKFAYDVDLSEKTMVRGIDFFGWAGDAYYDNILIEYVTDASVIPDPNVIYSEDFEGDKPLSSRVDVAGEGAVIENGVVKVPSERDLTINSKNGLVADAPYGRIHVNFDMKAPNNGPTATLAELVTDAGKKTLVSYGTWGGLRPHQTDGEYGANFDGDVWYNNDFVLDFINNKMYITIEKKADGTKALDNYEYSIDLSSISVVKGINFFGWAGDAYYDNILIEYVTEESETPDEPEFSKTIYEEDFEGDEPLASRVDVAGEGAVIENGVVKVPSEKDLTINSKNGLVADAPYGRIHVNFDMKAPNKDMAATLAELVTDAGKKTLVSYGTWGGLRPHQTDGEYGANFDGDVWYNNDFVLDFVNNKMYITIEKKADGTKALDNYEYSIDLSSISVVKGINFFGWAGDAYYDNILIEYVTEEPVIPDPNVIYEEDFEGDEALSTRVDTINGTVSIEDGLLKAAKDGGIVVNSKDAKVADAPYGQIRVNLDMKVKNEGTAATVASVVTDAGNKTLVSYGVWGGLRPGATDDAYNGASFDGDVWYNNEFILDFNQNLMYITVTRMDNGTKALDLYPYKLDLSGITSIKGIDLFGWAGDAYYDNIVIEYVAEELDLPDPDVIWEEDFEGDAAVASRVDTINGTATIENGLLKVAGEGGIVVNSKDGKVADAPYGQIRVNLDMKVKNSDLAATKAELVTNAGNKTLISYGTWGCLRPHPTEGQYGTAGFEGDVWYNNDFILDFNNNVIYITVTKKEDGTKVLDQYIYETDLSGITTVKGIDLYGWAGDAYYDNIVIEYVTEELDLPDPHVHSYTEEITVAPTHTSVGTKTFTCSCGDTYTEEIAKTPDHEYTGEVTTDATCGAEGVKTFTCACGDTYTETIPATGNHVYDDGVETLAPTTTAEGVKTYTCACGATYTEAIEKLPYGVAIINIAADAVADLTMKGGNVTLTAGQSIGGRNDVIKAEGVANDNNGILGVKLPDGFAFKEGDIITYSVDVYSESEGYNPDIYVRDHKDWNPMAVFYSQDTAANKWTTVKKIATYADLVAADTTGKLFTDSGNYAVYLRPRDTSVLYLDNFKVTVERELTGIPTLEKIVDYVTLEDGVFTATTKDIAEKEASGAWSSQARLRIIPEVPVSINEPLKVTFDFESSGIYNSIGQLYTGMTVNLRLYDSVDGTTQGNTIGYIRNASVIANAGGPVTVEYYIEDMVNGGGTSTATEIKSIGVQVDMNGACTYYGTQANDGYFTISNVKVENVKKPDHIHAYGNWTFEDGNNHKKECSCGEVIRGAHIWNDGVITSQPTELAAGVKTYTCTLCGGTYTEAIEKLPFGETIINITADAVEDYTMKGANVTLTADQSIGGRSGVIKAENVKNANGNQVGVSLPDGFAFMPGDLLTYSFDVYTDATINPDVWVRDHKDYNPSAAFYSQAMATGKWVTITKTASYDDLVAASLANNSTDDFDLAGNYAVYLRPRTGSGDPAVTVYFDNFKVIVEREVVEEVRGNVVNFKATNAYGLTMVGSDVVLTGNQTVGGKSGVIMASNVGNSNTGIVGIKLPDGFAFQEDDILTYSVDVYSESGINPDIYVRDHKDWNPMAVFYNGTIATGTWITITKTVTYAELVAADSTGALFTDAGNYAVYIRPRNGSVLYLDNFAVTISRVDYEEQPHEHAYVGVVETEATHMVEGTKVFTCPCGEAYTEAIAKDPTHTHTSEITTPATHFAEGVMTYTCVCGDTYTEAIPVIPHTYAEEITTPATCGADGVKTFTCECGDTYTEVIPATGAHVYSEEITLAPTVDAEGVKTFTCSCGDTYTEAIAKLRRGDIDGDNEISVKDLLPIRRFITGGYGATVDVSVADAYKDGVINAKDVITVRRFIAGGYGVEL